MLKWYWRDCEDDAFNCALYSYTAGLGHALVNAWGNALAITPQNDLKNLKTHGGREREGEKERGR